MSDSRIAVLEERIKMIEKDIEDLKLDAKRNDEKMTEISAFNGRIELMFLNLTEKQEKTEKKIDKLVEKQEKDNGWRAVLMDFLKLAGLLIVAIVTGKLALF